MYCSKLLLLLGLLVLFACGPVSHTPTPEPSLPGSVLQTATWTNPNKDAIWGVSWSSVGDAMFSVTSPYDGDFYITAGGHLTTDIRQALLSQPPVGGKPWEVTVRISEVLDTGQIMVVTFVRCDLDDVVCVEVPIGEAELSGDLQVDIWPKCSLLQKVAGTCFQLQQGTQGIGEQFRYTPKIHISMLGMSFKLSAITVTLSLRTQQGCSSCRYRY